MFISAREVDVLVAGGGPAGVGAAVASAREGAKTLLVEQYGCLGGMGTMGLVPAFAPINDGATLVTAGLAASIIDELKRQMPHVPAGRYDWVPIDPETLKRIYDRRVVDAGSSVLFHTQLTGVSPRLAPGEHTGGIGEHTGGIGEHTGGIGEHTGGIGEHTGDIGEPSGVATRCRIVEAAIFNKAGHSLVRAKYFIDCTGDADLAAFAGADFQKGDDTSGELQAATMCFLLTGVDSAKFFAWRDELPGRQRTKDAIARAKAAGDLDIPEGQITAIAYVAPNAVGLNFAHLFDIDGTDPEQASRGEIEGRMLAKQLADFLRKYCPGCADGFLAATGVLGIRETRRIVGEYRLVLDDYVSRRSFPDEILRNNYCLDLHGNKASQQAEGAGSGGRGERFKPFGPGESHGIPLRCLIPRRLANVLVAGRSLSADRPLQGACRCMPHCLGMGEAAGTAAAMAVAAGHDDIRQLDVQSLRTRLQSRGAYLP